MQQTDSARQRATDGADASRAADEGQLVVFNLAGEEFGVDINNVKEIVRLPEITPIPRSPGYVAGICNLRGIVLPVINTRERFAMEAQAATDRSRLLVVESGGVQTSMVVDSVREVRRMKRSLIEPPPEVCRGVDSQFLSGVVKVDEGMRLILMLELGQVVAVEAGGRRGSAAAAARETVSPEAGAAGTEEEQLVSFRVAEDEYAFHIEKVREILKVGGITAVPNVPDFVMGLFTIRNHLLPILDLRRLLGLPTLLSERIDRIDKAIREDQAWAANLQHTLKSGNSFTECVSARDTPAGRWLEAYRTSSVEVETLVKQLKRERSQLYDAAAGALKIRQSAGREPAATHFESEMQPLLDLVCDTYARFKGAIEETITEDQRALVVEAAGMTIGYQVDWVDEVLRIPRTIIDETPAMAASRRRELKAVAKLDDGERLIMIMDESAMVSEETGELLTDIREQAGGTDIMTDQERTLAEQSMEEEQLVTFAIDGEEYGIRIMQVQEINRLQEVTRVPRAPAFIDGMTNLRGSVIPVINVRRLFDLEEIEADDRTRIIIVDINGTRTGLRVDAVNEVLRLSKSDIDTAPEIVSGDEGTHLIQGVCKIDSGKRMVMLLDVARILDKGELKSLNAVMEKKGRTGRQSAAKGKTTPKPVKAAGPDRSAQAGGLEIAE